MAIHMDKVYIRLIRYTNNKDPGGVGSRLSVLYPSWIVTQIKSMLHQTTSRAYVLNN